MTQHIIAGLFTEGSTDTRFLTPILEKTLAQIAYECRGQVDTKVELIQISKTGLSFIEQVLEAAQQGQEFGMRLLCIHLDADDKTAEHVIKNKLEPAKKSLSEHYKDIYCIALIPVHETEAWMLADKDLLKAHIGTSKTDSDLGITKAPETVTHPKEIIETAIRIAREHQTKKRRQNLVIADLYLPIGQAVEVEKLDQLPSYQDFKEDVREAFRALNLL